MGGLELRSHLSLLSSKCTIAKEAKNTWQQIAMTHLSMGRRGFTFSPQIRTNPPKHTKKTGDYRSSCCRTTLKEEWGRKALEWRGRIFLTPKHPTPSPPSTHTPADSFSLFFLPPFSFILQFHPPKLQTYCRQECVFPPSLVIAPLLLCKEHDIYTNAFFFEGTLLTSQTVRLLCSD